MGVLPAAAKSTGKNNSNRQIAKKGKASELPVVQKVSPTGITVDGHVYEVNELTDVIVNGAKASVAQVQVGMQVSITSSPKTFGKTADDSVYKATRIVASDDNKLAEKADEYNKQAAENANKGNQNSKNKKH